MVEGQTREIGAGSRGPTGALITRNVIESSVIFARFFALWEWDSGGRKGEGRAFPFRLRHFDLCCGENPVGYPRYVGERGRGVEKGLPMIVKCRRLEYMGYALRSDEQWAALMKAEGKRISHISLSLIFLGPWCTIFKFHHITMARLELLLLGCKTSEWIDPLVKGVSTT